MHSAPPAPAIVVAALCDLGASYGKGKEFQAIVESLATGSNRTNTLGIFRSIHRAGDAANTVRLQQALPFGNLFFRMFVLIERLLGKIGISFASRQAQDALFDFVVSRRLPAQTKVLMTLPGMTRTLRQAKKLGATTVLHGVVMHPAYNLTLLDKIFPRGDYPSVWSRRMMLASQSSMAYVDRVICPSTRCAASYIEHGYRANDIDIAPLGYESPAPLAAVDCWPATGPLNVVFVGNVTRMKGADVLLQAIPLLNPQEFCFHIVGDIQRDLSGLCARAAQLSNVHFYGQHPAADLYPRMHVLVLPSLSEGQARVILEAGVFGLLVVTSKIANGDLVEDGVSGHLCSDDPQQLAAILQRTKEHPNEALVLRHNLQVRCSNLSWSAFGTAVAYRLEQLAITSDVAYTAAGKYII